MFDWLPSSFDLKFWANFVATLVGVLFAWLAFGQARLAKELAAEAGKTVKIQTITIELTEIVQRLDRLEYGLSFSEARDLLNEITRRLMRLIAPFRLYGDIQEPYSRLNRALDEAGAALQSVEPPDGDDQQIAANSVYFATQSHFASISRLVAEIIGIFEARTIEVKTE